MNSTYYPKPILRIPSVENIGDGRYDTEDISTIRRPECSLVKKSQLIENASMNGQNGGSESSDEMDSPLISPQSKIQGNKNSMSEIPRHKARKLLYRLTPLRQSFDSQNNKPKEKSKQSVQVILDTLKNHFVFQSLNRIQIKNIIPKFQYAEVKATQYICKQGEEGNVFFIIEKGRVRIIANGQNKNELGPGCSFGELALLYNAPRHASILALDDVGVWYIDQQTFKRTVEEITLNELEENKKLIDKLPIFENFTSRQKENIAGIMLHENYATGDYILHEGDDANSFYVIMKGTVAMLHGESEELLKQLGQGDTFGDSALLGSQSTRYMSTKALTPVVCLSLAREKVKNILGDKLQNIAYKNMMRWACERSDMFKELTDIDKEKIVESMKLIQGKKGTVLLKQGQPCEFLIVPLEGNLVDKEDNIIGKRNMIYGQEYQKQAFKNTSTAHDIIIDYDGAYCIINKGDLQQVLGASFDPSPRKARLGNFKFRLEKLQIKEEQSSAGLNGLIYLQKLGKGQFGNVFLVEDANQNKYALKCVEKKKVQMMSLERHVKEERNILLAIDHPLLMSFHRTFRDELHVYFLTEFIIGKDLFDAIRDIGLLNRQSCQFYIAGMILALEYLHENEIIYRDLKPENIMVDHAGYPKMIDFGASRKLSAPHRTFTLIGTPTYMAPEVVSGQGYSFSSDFWSVGICLYEFLCGSPPFGEGLEDPYDVYSEIMSKKLTYPPFMKDKKAKRLIDILLNKTPEMRCKDNFVSLKTHPWFNGFEWEKMLNKELEPPYVPEVEKMFNEKDFEIYRNEKLSIKEYINTMADTTPTSSKKLTWDKEF